MPTIQTASPSSIDAIPMALSASERADVERYIAATPEGFRPAWDVKQGRFFFIADHATPRVNTGALIYLG